MGSGPNETEIRMFFVLTIAFVIGGLLLGTFAHEFEGASDDLVDEGKLPDAIVSRTGMVSAVLGMFTMFIPGLGFSWLPTWMAVFLTLLQLIWGYLLFAIAIRPLIPLT